MELVTPEARCVGIVHVERERAQMVHFHVTHITNESLL